MDFEVVAVEAGGKIQEVDFQGSFLGGLEGWAKADVGNTAGRLSAWEHRLDRINPVGGELLVVGFEVRGGETEPTSQFLAFDYRAQDCEWPPETELRRFEVSTLDGLTDAGAADRLASDFDGRDLNGPESGAGAQFPDPIDRPRAVLPKCPPASDNDLRKRTAAFVE